MRQINKIFNYIVFTTLLLVITVAVVEVGTMAVFYLFKERWPSRAEIQKTLDHSPQQTNVRGVNAIDATPYQSMQFHVLHPYLGFIRDYSMRRHLLGNRVIKVPVNEYGFFGGSPVRLRSDDKVIVAVTGGSVSLDFYLKARETLRQELKKMPALAGKKIEIVSVALGGMKQPQQMMALNYFLALGGQFDIVINIDGFNEVVLPISDNIPLGVFPFYPRFWRLYTTKAIDFDSMILVADINEKKMRVEEWRSRFSKFPFRHSNFFLALWHIYSNDREAELVSLEDQLRKQLVNRKLTSQEKGPFYSYQSESDIFSDSAEMWKRTSIQMWKISRANGIAYFHFLQPNQYVSGTKKLTDKERRIAFAGPENSFRRGAEQGYRFLISAGKDLKKMGLPFFDLTKIFKEESGTIYNDNCCHYNQRGNDLLATRIANVIAESL